MVQRCWVIGVQALLNTAMAWNPLNNHGVAKLRWKRHSAEFCMQSYSTGTACMYGVSNGEYCFRVRKAPLVSKARCAYVSYRWKNAMKFRTWWMRSDAKVETIDVDLTMELWWQIMTHDL